MIFPEAIRFVPVVVHPPGHPNEFSWLLVLRCASLTLSISAEPLSLIRIELRFKAIWRLSRRMFSFPMLSASGRILFLTGPMEVCGPIPWHELRLMHWLTRMKFPSFMSGVDPKVPGNGGPDCAAYLSLTQRLVETVIFTLVGIGYTWWSYNRIRLPHKYAYIRKDRGGKRALLVIMSLVWGIEIGFKFSSRTLIYLLNPCHITTAIQVQHCFWFMYMAFHFPLPFANVEYVFQVWLHEGEHNPFLWQKYISMKHWVLGCLLSWEGNLPRNASSLFWRFYLSVSGKRNESAWSEREGTVLGAWHMWV